MEGENARMVEEFHRRFGVPVADAPRIPPMGRRNLRVALIAEELAEFRAASELGGDAVEAADALADLLYVVYGAALEWGIPVDDVFREVHRSNMTKVWPDGEVHYRADGKILKPDTYSPPDVRAVLRAGSCKRISGGDRGARCSARRGKSGRPTPPGRR